MLQGFIKKILNNIGMHAHQEQPRGELGIVEGGDAARAARAPDLAVCPGQDLAVQFSVADARALG